MGGSWEVVSITAITLEAKCFEKIGIFYRRKFKKITNKATKTANVVYLTFIQIIWVKPVHLTPPET